jgi:Flp pilus assembly protein TadG
MGSSRARWTCPLVRPYASAADGAPGMSSTLQCTGIRRGRSATAQTSRRLLADRAGAATVEFAIVGTLFLLLLFGIIEIGRGLWTMNALNYAVQQAARCASLNSTDCGNQGGVQTFAVGVSATLIPSTTFTLAQYSDYSCTTVTAIASRVKAKKVSASYAMTLYIPFVSMQPTLAASSCFPVK